MSEGRKFSALLRRVIRSHYQKVKIKVLRNEMEDLNTQLIAKSLGYHGLPLQKAWEEEYGASDLKKLGLVNLDYSTYFARQKNLTFSDRAKRLRLHQFMCKKAEYLFNTNSIEALSKRNFKERPLAGKILS